MPPSKQPRCRFCKKKIKMMCQKNTGYCCALCAEGRTDNPGLREPVKY